MSKKHKEVTLNAEEIGEGSGAAPRKEEKPLTINRLSDWIHGGLVNALSHLRLSLTLRIALHHAGQMLLTTIPMLLALTITLCALEVPRAREAMRQVAELEPAQELVYSEEQLRSLAASEAYLTEEAVPKGLASFEYRYKLAASSFDKPDADGKKSYTAVLLSHTGGVLCIGEKSVVVSSIRNVSSV